jgi:hypothetical protein
MNKKWITIKFKSRSIKNEINCSRVGFEVLTVVVMGHNTMWSTESQPLFQRNTLPSSSKWKSKPSMTPAKLTACFILDCCSVYSSTMKTEVKCFSGLLVGFQQTTQRYIPEERALPHSCLKHILGLEAVSHFAAVPETTRPLHCVHVAIQIITVLIVEMHWIGDV